MKVGEALGGSVVDRCDHGAVPGSARRPARLARRAARLGLVLRSLPSWPGELAGWVGLLLDAAVCRGWEVLVAGPHSLRAAACAPRSPVATSSPGAASGDVPRFERYSW
jgi:hypothetical protein